MGLSGSRLRLQILEFFVDIYYILEGSTVSDNMTSSIASMASQGALTSPVTTVARLSLRLLISVLVPRLRTRLCVGLRLGRGLGLISWGHLVLCLVALRPVLGFLL